MNLQTNAPQAQKARRKIAVLFGGRSSEYDVSLQSAHAVLSQIDPAKYEPVPVGITREGRWFLFTGEPDRLLSDTWQMESCCRPCCLSPDRTLHGLIVWEDEKIRTLSLDAAFPVLHGKNGEDGTVQGVLELAGIPIIGCGTLGSALCMDKDMAHRAAAAAGVRVPASFLVKTPPKKEELQREAEKLGYPLFVKPVRSGSSFGITKVSSPDGLETAVQNALLQDSQALLEEAIAGFEVGCAVMGDAELTVGEIDEIELSEGFFDYTEKYTLQTSRIHVPARIPPVKAEEIKETAKKLYRALGCRIFARVDLFLTPDGSLVFNEINTIPGFTAHSRFPKMMEAAGLPFHELVEKLLEMGGEHENC